MLECFRFSLLSSVANTIAVALAGLSESSHGKEFIIKKTAVNNRVPTYQN